MGRGRLVAGKGIELGAKIGFECVAPEHRRKTADDSLDTLTIVNGEWAFCLRGLRAEGHEWRSTGGEEYPALIRRIGHTIAASEARAS